MNSTPVIDMFSGTGELARAVADGLNEFTGFQSFSDNYGPARKYLKARFRNVEIPSDFRDQDVPEGSIVAIGAPCQDLSVAGRHAGAERGSGSRSSLIHDALDMAVTGGADLIVAENVPGGHRTYLDLARRLETEHDYQTTVSSAGAWEVGAPHRRERIMLVAARRHFEPRHINVVRQVEPRHMVPTPTASSSTGPGRSGRNGGANLQTWIHEGNRPSPLDSTLWAHVTGLPEPRLKDDEGRMNAAFVEWLMGLPSAHAVGLSRTASIRLAGNAVVRLQARLMLQRGLTAINHSKGDF
jgi:cytosine-specific methyltransferase|nr:MAG TPA: Cytosine specific methyltransferase [Caudoviricetes sp.]